MQNLKNQTALITGASSGIGEAFAHELAQRGANLLITARSSRKLTELAQTLEQSYGAKVTVFVEDLSISGSAERLYAAIKEEGYSIDLLINNAGFGKWAPFLDETMATYEEMIDLNITSLTALCHLVLPEMLARKKGGIINVASTGAFQPCPYIGVYCASKAYVLSLSEALYGEYADKGISVLALCPGNTVTSFQSVANANTRGMREDSPGRVAKEGIEALLKKKSYQVVGMDNYLVSLLPRFLSRKTIIGIVVKTISGRM